MPTAVERALLPAVSPSDQHLDPSAGLNVAPYQDVTRSTSPGFLNPGSAVGFNPQPEPPGDFIGR